MGDAMLKPVCLILMLAYVSAVPYTEDLVIPESELVQSASTSEYAAAKKHLNELMASGKDDQQCRDLASASKQEVKDAVENTQKILDALSDGSDCANLGQKQVQDTKSAFDTAEQN